ncbi:MAG TPA: magnesium/cobalt transporter CorA [Bacteroidales bacterium]|nr:magnesium/cobalt transporter CorA [Bacteroidales bacterium]
MMKHPHSSFIKIMHRKAGQAPGTLVAQEPDQEHPTTVRLITFREQNFQQTEITDVAQLPQLISADTTNWIHVTGYADLSVFEKLGVAFNISNLTIEDVLNPGHLPKFEDAGDYLFLTLKLLSPKNEQGEYGRNQISMVLLPGTFISFAQYPALALEEYISRIEKAIGTVRQRHEDYLLYRLTDIIVDEYFGIFEQLEEQIFTTEEDLTNDPAVSLAAEINALKKNVYYLRKQLLPANEAVRKVMKTENPLITKPIFRFFSDVMDHLDHLVQLLEGYRETITGLLELQSANNANRMNEVMKTLTMIATIFIPLTFIAGVYGMNFHYMPELAYPWAYPAALGLMLLIGVAMYLYMRKMRWF